MINWLALLACTPPPTTAGTQGVELVDIHVTIEAEPAFDPYDILETAEWLDFPHCSTLYVDGDLLVSRGPLPDGTATVYVLDYGGWGGAFSGMGTSRLEIALTADDAHTLVGALNRSASLYALLADVTEGDTGVPGGVREVSYDATGVPRDTVITEIHERWPAQTYTLVEEPAQPCAR